LAKLCPHQRDAVIRYPMAEPRFDLSQAPRSHAWLDRLVDGIAALGLKGAEVVISRACAGVMRGTTAVAVSIICSTLVTMSFPSQVEAKTNRIAKRITM
jgi:hypothetical protein